MHNTISLHLSWNPVVFLLSIRRKVLNTFRWTSFIKNSIQSFQLLLNQSFFCPPQDFFRLSPLYCVSILRRPIVPDFASHKDNVFSLTTFQRSLFRPHFFYFFQRLMDSEKCSTVHETKIENFFFLGDFQKFIFSSNQLNLRCI